MLYDCAIVDEIHIARKQYLDGSIPTGFQRTTIVGVTGRIPYKDRAHPHHPARPRGGRLPRGQRRRPPPRLPDRPPGHAAHRDRHRPRHAHARRRSPRSAQILRRLVRSTGQRADRASAPPARTSTSASRGGTRIEIKGVPRIPRIPLLTYNEAMRQWNLLRLREELHAAAASPRRPSPPQSEDVTRILRKTRYQPDPRRHRRRARSSSASCCAASAGSCAGRPRPTPTSPARSPTASGSSPA